jgi:hypothetical protein
LYAGVEPRDDVDVVSRSRVAAQVAGWKAGTPEAQEPSAFAAFVPFDE